MVDTQTVKESPILTRSTELYMGLCQLSAQMHTQLNYNDLPALRETFKDFRYYMYELYYLLIDLYEFDPELKVSVDRWSTINKVPVKKEREFYIESLNIFKNMKTELNRLSIIAIVEGY